MAEAEGGPEPTPPAPDFAASIGGAAAFIVLAYGLLLLAARLNASPFLDAAEAVLVGQTDMRWLYGGDPPFRHWLARVSLETFDWDWPQALGIATYGALVVYLYALYACARALAGARAGGLAVIAAGLTAPAAWFVAAPAETALAMGTGAASVYALFRVLRAPSAGRLTTLALFLAAAILTEIAFLLFWVPFLAALALSAAARPLLSDWRIWVATGGALLLCLPTLLAAGFQTEAPAQTAPLDSWAAMYWIGGPAVLWVAAINVDRRLGASAPPSPSRLMPPLVAGTVLLGAILVGLTALVGAAMLGVIAEIEPGVMAAILGPVPLCLALGLPLARSALAVAALSFVGYAAALGGPWLIALYGDDRRALPYEAIAAQMRRLAPRPVPVRTEHPEDRANLILALDWPSARSGAAPPLERDAILLWRGRGEAPGDLIPEGFGPSTAVRTMVVRYENAFEGLAVFSFQRAVRLAAAPTQSAPASSSPPAAPIEPAPAPAELQAAPAETIPPPPPLPQ